MATKLQSEIDHENQMKVMIDKIERKQITSGNAYQRNLRKKTRAA